MKAALLLVAAVLAVAAAAGPLCHNATGTCLSHGFVCVSGEVVPHAQRCNGVEECTDGTDEYLCDHADPRPMAERTPEERHASQQASCVNCNCQATAYLVGTTSPWWSFATVAPTDISLMTGASAQFGGRPCSSTCTTSITLGFYKKNRICRGWLCCVRQRACVSCTTTPSGCSGVTTTNRCLA